jgi:predicted enzyme related to lactoylglutathione lyase
MTSDVDRARSFYGELLGWGAEEPAAEFGGYVNFTLGGERVAGLMPAQPDMDVHDVWSVYLAVEDAAKTTELATAHGGQILVPAMPVGDLGVMTVVSDVSGGVIGIWQPGVHKGFKTVAETGAPSWFELYTKDYAAAVPFYQQVFGWTTKVASDAADMRYTAMVEGEDWLAGIMDASGILPAEVPSCWAVYFGVDDTDAALKKIADLGGSVVTPAEDTPYGRLASATDPMGAQFKLVAPNAQMPAR